VALVREAGRQGDFHEGVAGIAQPVAGPLDAELASVLTDGAAEMAAEGGRQVDGMNARGTGHIVQ
jgi:hypothetical protein